MIEGYRALLPNSDEDRKSYALRLEALGFEEMFIRMALRYHFQMKIEEFPDFFESHDRARLGHIALLSTLRPGRSDYALARKLSRNLGISLERADQLVARYPSGANNSVE